MIHARPSMVGRIAGFLAFRLKGARTGQLLVDALQASPHRKIELELRRSAMPARAIKL